MASIPVRPAFRNGLRNSGIVTAAGVAPRPPAPPRFFVPPTPAAPTGLTVLGLMSCVRRRWKRALLIGLVLGSAVACLVWMFLPPAKPYASTKLFFQKPPSSVEHPDPPVNQQTQKELITSRVVLRAALEDPLVSSLSSIVEKGDPMSWLIRDLEIDFPTNSEIMRITLREDRADEAKIIVDKVAEAYMTMIGNESRENRKLHLQKLQGMVDAAKRDFDADSETSRSDLPGSIGSTSPEVIAQNQRMLNNEITLARNEIERFRDLLKTLRVDEAALAKRLEITPVAMTAAEFEPVFNVNPNTARLKQLRDELQAEYDSRLAGLGENNPTMITLKARVVAAEARLEASRKELKTNIAAAFQEKLTEDLRKKREDIAKLEADEKARQRDVLAKQAELEQLKLNNNRVGRLKPAMTAKGDRLTDLTAKLSKLESEMTAPLAVRTIDGEAVIVRPHDASRRMKMATMAAIAMFGLAFLGIGFMEFRANRLGSAGEVPQALGLRIMGTVPARPRNAAVGMDDHEWESVVNEAVDSARTVFLHSASIQQLRTVMVTSAVGGEGKTSLSASLAASLARSGRRTLLIDADMRNPSVHGHFGLNEGPGLSEVMRGERSALSVIVQTQRENLSIMPAGRCDARTLQALAQDEFSRVLAEIGHETFDFILIDTCPVLPVADALLIARHADGVLLSLLVDYSQVDRVNAACQKLASVDVPLLGAVVNGTRGDSFAYGYGYRPDARLPALA